MNILFITTSSLATNPRLVKELRTCIAFGHKVTVVSFLFSNWSESLNNELLREFETKVNFVNIIGDRTNKKTWLISSVANFFSRLLVRFNSNNVYILAFAISKRAWLLFQILRKLEKDFQLIIAHNPGAFVPALAFAKRTKSKFGIDVEDFHPGESNHAVEIKRMEKMMVNVFNETDVITAASPLILKESQQLILSTKMKQVVIQNVFSKKFQPLFKKLPLQPLRLIWFSQTVGLNRGLQDVILAMTKIENVQIELTIVGNCQKRIKNYFIDLLKSDNHRVIFLSPVKEQEVIEQCSQHHIGLALEPGFSLNNQLALSNKLFTYLLAGNAVISSETLAQKQFIDENPSVGKTYPIGNLDKLVKLLLHYIHYPDELLQTRKASYRSAREVFNWELESQKFVQTYGLN